jgi:hypothetical protein
MNDAVRAQHIRIIEISAHLFFSIVIILTSSCNFQNSRYCRAASYAEKESVAGDMHYSERDKSADHREKDAPVV